MLKTTFQGAEIIHRILWKIVEREAEDANNTSEGWFYPALVAMVFAFHTVEAYLNYVGERLDPSIWTEEREYFRNEPYRGSEGKIRKVLELVGLTWSPQVGPLKTVLELKKLRDLIAHGKSEKISGTAIHSDDTVAATPESTLRQMIMPKERLNIVISDVTLFIHEIHQLAAPKVKDHWFGEDALHGTSQFTSYETTLHPKKP